MEQRWECSREDLGADAQLRRGSKWRRLLWLWGGGHICVREKARSLGLCQHLNKASSKCCCRSEEASADPESSDIALLLYPQRPRDDCAVCMLAGPGLAGRSGQVCLSVVRGRDEATTGGKSRGSRSGRGSTAGGAPVNRSWLIFKCNHKENEIWRF